MIVLDTNIISEMMKKKPEEAVIEWIDQQDTNNIYITAISIAEIAYGLDVLPSGKRRHSLERAFNAAVNDAFEDRILAFSELAAFHYGILMGHRKKIGKPMAILDGQIAAIAKVNKAKIATRNIRDFENCQLDLVNPFASSIEYSS